MLFPKYINALYVLPASMLPAHWIDADYDRFVIEEGDPFPLRQIPIEGLTSLETLVEYENGRATYVTTLTAVVLSVEALIEADYKTAPVSLVFDYTDGTRGLIGIGGRPAPVVTIGQQRGATPGEPARTTLSAEWRAAFPPLTVCY